MTAHYLKPDIRVALDRIADYADTCWTVYGPCTRKGRCLWRRQYPASQICTTRRTAATPCCATSAQHRRKPAATYGLAGLSTSAFAT